MRMLFNIIEGTWWSTISAAVFFALFTFLIFQVYRPSRRKQLEDESKLVFSDEDTQI